MWLQPRAILERSGPVGQPQGLGARQAGILNALMDPRRLVRMGEMEILQPEDAWPLAEYVPAVRRAVFGDLTQVSAVDGYRRALQRAWVERAAYLMTEEPASNPFFGPGVDVSRSDVRPLVRRELRALRSEAATAAGRVRHPVTRAHLEDLVARIDTILEDSDGN